MAKKVIGTGAAAIPVGCCCVGDVWIEHFVNDIAEQVNETITFGLHIYDCFFAEAECWIVVVGTSVLNE